MLNSLHHRNNYINNNNKKKGGGGYNYRLTAAEKNRQKEKANQNKRRKVNHHPHTTTTTTTMSDGGTTTSSSIRDLMMEEDPLAASILLKDLHWLEELLLSRSKRNVNYTVPYTSNTPLLLAITSCNDNDPSTCLQIVQLLIEKGDADIECGNTFHGVTPLMAACTTTTSSSSGCQQQQQQQQQEQQNLELVAKYLLSKGANVHVRTTNGRTPLINCCKNGNLPLVKLLIEEYQADVLLYDEQAKNALMHACTENHVDVVRYLLDCIPKLVNDFKVDTAMWYACAAGNADIVQLLIDRGGLIEYRQDGTIYSTTPLMEACEWGHLQVVETLLWNGANATSKTGQKALKLANSAGHHAVVKLMTVWQQRIQGLELFLKSSDRYSNDHTTGFVPPSLLPLVLSKTGRRLDLVNRIVFQRWDIIANKGCCSDSSSVKNF